MRSLLLLLHLCLEGIINFRKTKRFKKHFANDKSLTKIINVISVGSVKFLSQNCLNTLID